MKQLKDTYYYSTLKRKFEKLYSDYISLDVHKLNDKQAQWYHYDIERSKLIQEYCGYYQTLVKYDETFSIGDKINIHYMETKQGIIKDIEVRFDNLTHDTEYVLWVLLDDGSIRQVDHRVCIHLAETEEK